MWMTSLKSAAKYAVTKSTRRIYNSLNAGNTSRIVQLVDLVVEVVVLSRSIPLFSRNPPATTLALN